MPQTFTAPVERKHPRLPRHAIVPADVADGQPGTFVSERHIAPYCPCRRSIKPGGDRRWFVALTGPLCRAAGVDTGDTIAIILAEATATPTEPVAARASAGLARAFAAPGPADRRAAEHVFAAKKPDTRARRIAGILTAFSRR